MGAVRPRTTGIQVLLAQGSNDMACMAVPAKERRAGEAVKEPDPARLY